MAVYSLLCQLCFRGLSSLLNVLLGLYRESALSTGPGSIAVSPLDLLEEDTHVIFRGDYARWSLS